MDKQHFDQLVKGVRETKRHMAGKSVRGARTTELPAPDLRTIREAARISQSQFAKLIGVNLRTLQTWEQHRTQPTGPARALLKIVASINDALRRKQAADSLLSIADRVATAGIPPMSMKEINAEVKAARAERKQRAGGH
jgi:putative transcriptional regulator